MASPWMMLPADQCTHAWCGVVYEGRSFVVPKKKRKKFCSVWAGSKIGTGSGTSPAHLMKREQRRTEPAASASASAPNSGSPPGDTSKQGEGEEYGSPAQPRIPRAPLCRCIPPPPLPPSSSSCPCRPRSDSHPPPARPTVPALRLAAWYSGRYPYSTPFGGEGLVLLLLRSIHFPFLHPLPCNLATRDSSFLLLRNSVATAL